MGSSVAEQTMNGWAGIRETGFHGHGQKHLSVAEASEP